MKQYPSIKIGLFRVKIIYFQIHIIDTGQEYNDEYFLSSFGSESMMTLLTLSVL